MTQFDEAGAEFDAKEHPSQKHEGDRRGGDMRRAKERREKSCLEEHRFPAEAVERLAHVDDREVQHPDGQPDDRGQPNRARLRETQECDHRKDDT